MHFKNQTVVITGGSRGLGYALAKLFLDEGATVALLARTVEQLDRAVSRLPEGAHAFPCDVGNASELRATLERIASTLGPIDVLVNVAGIMQVSPFEQVTQKEFAECMGTHFWGPLHAVQAVLPSMKARKAGRIVNVASFGGIVSLPRLLPYIASKHALVALSQGLYAELKPLGITVTTVCPGMMRSGSHWQIKVRGPHTAAFAISSLLFSSPLAQDADTVAKKIFRATKRGTPVLDLTWTTTALRVAQALAPNLYVRATALASRLLPAASADPHMYTAQESESVIAPSILTAVADAKAVELNELPL